MAELREGIVISDRYEVRHLVGSGGFGQVWYGFDDELQREIAIKRLLSRGFRSSEDRNEMMEEARKIASLSHPNIVSVYDVLSYDDELVLIMEYLHGGSLQAYLRKLSREQTWIDVSESIRILKWILSGLEAAHNCPQGPIIHRDLKPLNILFHRDFHAKIVDFGLATIGITEEIKTAHPGKWEHEGTFGYKSSEQLKGAQIDVRSDLFNIGLIACILFAAAHPFIDHRFLFDYKEMVFEPYRDVTVTLGSHLTDGIKEFILKLVAVDPVDRFQTTSEALSELEYVEETYNEQLLNRTIDFHDALKAGNETAILSMVELAEGISLCKRKGFFFQGAFLYERSGKDFSDLPPHLNNRMEEDYKNCKRRAGQEVDVK